jgi:hypothetical protein
MALHLARSGGSKGSWEKCHDQVVFAIIVIDIADQPILGGGKGKVESFLTHQGFLLLRRQTGEGKKK